MRRRFEREALALRQTVPEVHLSWFEVTRFTTASVLGDWRAARRNKITLTTLIDMARYRWNQFTGSYKSSHKHKVHSQSAKERFFYPQVSKKADQDEWLKPVRRTSPYESQQSES